MVATFTQPNNTTQDSNTYKNNLDGSISVLSQMGDMFAPHQSSPAGMTITIDSGMFLAGGSLVQQNAQTSGTITAPATGYSRIDMAVIDGSTGLLSIVAGLPAASNPTPPVLPAGQLPVALISLTAATQQIFNSAVTDYRAMIVSPQFGGVPIGCFLPFAGQQANIPAGWLLCDGSSYGRTGTYAALFAAIGTTWGYADANHFNVPDLRGRFPLGAGQGATGEGGTTGTNRTLGQISGVSSGVVGAEAHTMTEAELISHNHGGATGAENTAHSHNLPSIAGGGSYYAPGGVFQYGAEQVSGSENQNHTHNISSDGGDNPMSIMNPFAVVNYIIRYQ